GLAFQITDDLLDYVGDVVETGKEPGNDITTGKVTLPLIYSLRHGEKGKSREIMKLLGNGVDKGEFKTVLRYVVESGGIDYASRRAIQTAHEGLAAVDGLKDSIYYSSLLGMVDYSTSRAG
ncbi:MAG: polyprenyl synthetase family protein, partial [candidate division Zixibacteria bacterium]|nr:polyprenyl synthetase family protein [candidate division Zixibacteria bacterium]